jgi:hypothetical protein
VYPFGGKRTSGEYVIVVPISPASWKKGGEAIYLGGITEMVPMARSKRGVRSAGVRWQHASQQRAR